MNTTFVTRIVIASVMIAAMALPSTPTLTAQAGDLFPVANSVGRWGVEAEERSGHVIARQIMGRPAIELRNNTASLLLERACFRMGLPGAVEKSAVSTRG